MPSYCRNLARQLDFGQMTTTLTKSAGGDHRGVRAVQASLVRGPDKYKVLEHRRRQAQIAARRLLDSLDLRRQGAVTGGRSSLRTVNGDVVGR